MWDKSPGKNLPLSRLGWCVGAIIDLLVQSGPLTYQPPPSPTPPPPPPPPPPNWMTPGHNRDARSSSFPLSGCPRGDYKILLNTSPSFPSHPQSAHSLLRGYSAHRRLNSRGPILFDTSQVSAEIESVRPQRIYVQSPPSQGCTDEHSPWRILPISNWLYCFPKYCVSKLSMQPWEPRWIETEGERPWLSVTPSAGQFSIMQWRGKKARRDNVSAGIPFSLPWMLHMKWLAKNRLVKQKLYSHRIGCKAQCELQEKRQSRERKHVNTVRFTGWQWASVVKTKHNASNTDCISASWSTNGSHTKTFYVLSNRGSRAHGTHTPQLLEILFGGSSWEPKATSQTLWNLIRLLPKRMKLADFVYSLLLDTPFSLCLLSCAKLLIPRLILRR